MRITMAAILIITAVAGCAEGPGEPDPLQEVDVTPFEDIIQERPLLASVAIHEEPTKNGVGALAFEAFGAEREPHDGELSYHGVAEVHDEWGRLVPAHVFRYNPMVFVFTDIEITTEGVAPEGEYQEQHWEFYFDAADGRMMGLTNLDQAVRTFSGPDNQLPFGPGYIGEMLLWMVEYMHGDITAPVVWEWGGSNTTFWLEPYAGDRPLAGDCEMYLRRAESSTESTIKPNPDPYRSIVCFDGSMIPLWSWSGNESEGAFSLERQGPGFGWPGPMGEILDPDPFATAPMEPIDPLLPGADPIFVPPSDTGEDWATAVRERVAALHYSIPYHQYELTHGVSYADGVSTGFSPQDFTPLLADPLGTVTDVAGHEETSSVMLTEGEDGQGFWTFVHTLHAGEGQRHHVPDQNGWTLPSSHVEMPSLEELGDVVETASVRGRVHELAPADANYIGWHVFPEFRDGPPTLWWTAGTLCPNEAEIPGFLLFDGKDGHLIAARTTPSEEPCAQGFQTWPNGEQVTVFPATPDRPFPVVLDAAGALALPLPLGAAEFVREPI